MCVWTDDRVAIEKKSSFFTVLYSKLVHFVLIHNSLLRKRFGFHYTSICIPNTIGSFIRTFFVVNYNLPGQYKKRNSKPYSFILTIIIKLFMNWWKSIWNRVSTFIPIHLIVSPQKFLFFLFNKLQLDYPFSIFVCDWSFDWFGTRFFSR